MVADPSKALLKKEANDEKNLSKLTKDELVQKIKEQESKTEVKKSVYETLSKIDVTKYLEKAGERYDKENKKYVPLNYLPWAKAWGLVKAAYPRANYKLLEYPNYIQTKNGLELAGVLDYRITKIGCEVGATVEIEGESYTQRLYVMDQKNKPVSDPDIAQINKAQMRALVKALAIAGLGLDVYAGEDLPSNSDETSKKQAKQTARQSVNRQYNGKRKKYDGPVEGWTTKDLEDYPLNFNGKVILLSQAFSGVQRGNKDAKEFVDSLKGVASDAYVELNKRFIAQSN